MKRQREIWTPRWRSPKKVYLIQMTLGTLTHFDIAMLALHFPSDSERRLSLEKESIYPVAL